jgi:branched-chain amino acid transport system permease protein
MVLLNILLSSVLVGGIYALFAVGLSLLLGVMRVFNIAHGALLTVVAMATISVARHTGWGFVPLVLVAVGMGAALGVPLELLAIRPFRRVRLLREDMEHGTMLATLAFLFVANNLLIHYTGAAIWLFPGGSFPTNIIRIGDVGHGVVYFIAFAVSIALILLLGLAIQRTQIGRAVRAIAADYRSARLLGINVDGYSLAMAVLASALAGLAGVLLGMAFTAVSWNFGDELLFQGFAIVVLGGLGSIPGTLIAALSLSILQGLVAYYAGGSWNDAIAFGVLMLVLALRPQGIFGRPEVVRA